MQALCKSEKKVDSNNTHVDNIEKQCVKLIIHFYKKRNLDSYFMNNNRQDSLEEFVSISIWYLYSKNIIKNYDSHKSKLSTYINYILQQQYIFFIFMINYNCSYNRARRICDIKTDPCLSEKEKELRLSQLLIGYDNTYSLNNKFEGKRDSGDTLELIDLIKDDRDDFKEVEFKETLQSFYEWLDTTKSLNARRKNIVKDYIKYQNLNKVAELNNCSRQNVSYVIQKVKARLTRMLIN